MYSLALLPTSLLSFRSCMVIPPMRGIFMQILIKMRFDALRASSAYQSPTMQ